MLITSRGENRTCKRINKPNFYLSSTNSIERHRYLSVICFKIVNLDTLQKIFSVQKSLFVGNIVEVSDKGVANDVLQLVRQCHNVVWSTICVGSDEKLRTNIIKQLSASDSPILWLIDNTYDKQNLPDGALTHILAQDSELQPILRKILQDYRDVFPSKLPLELPPNRGLADVHKIELIDGAKPIAKSPYKQGPSEQLLIKKEIDELLAAGLIKQSSSPWASPVLFVKKPDGSLRFCIDFRGLNSLTKNDKFPLPRAQDLIDRLAGAKYFSRFDLRSGYWQLKIDPQDTEKTAFTTRYGQYEWLVMPFGLTNAPATFQRVVNQLFTKQLDKCIVVFLDDVMVYSKTLSDHERHLRAVCELFRQHKFYAKLKKCEFFCKHTTFLGHDIDESGVHINQDKIKSVQAWPTPANKREVQQFIGFAQYFRQFIRGFSELAFPLTQLSKQDIKFDWNESCDKSFKSLKERLTTAPCLHIIDFTLPNASLEVHTDASGVALGGVLYQSINGKLLPCAYHSRKFKPAELNYSTTEKELLAIVDACRTWHHYLYGQDFIVRTDHKPLQYFFSQPNLSARQLRWAEYLSEFMPGMKILYLQGSKNMPADLQSRRTDYLSHESVVDLGLYTPQTYHSGLATLNAISTVNQSGIGSSQLWLLQEQDASLRGVWKQAKSTGSKFCTREGLLYMTDGRLVVPSPLISTIISEYHDHSGHFGIHRTVAKIKQKFWFPQLQHQCNQYIKQCDVCARIKPTNQRPQGLLQPLPIPERPWQHVSMDFITDLPPTKNKNTSILVVVDRFSKMVHLSLLSDDTTAPAVADAFMQNIVKLHGLPKTIVSDRDPRFTSRFWKELVSQVGTQLLMSSAYHPETDGQTERTIRTIEQVLRSQCYTNPSDWDKYLAQVEMYYNAFPSMSTGMSPYKVVYGTEMMLPIDLMISDEVPAVTTCLQNMQDIWAQVKQNILKAQQQQKQYADSHRREESFNVGDLVLLCTTNISMQPQVSRKLVPHFCGPFKVTQCIGHVAYHLELPSSMKIHPVFHVSLLRRYVGCKLAPPDPIITDDGEEWLVDKIVGHRVVRGVKQYLVQFVGYDQSSNEWLTEDHLKNAKQVLHEYKVQQGL